MHHDCDNDEVASLHHVAGGPGHSLPAALRGFLDVGDAMHGTGARFQRSKHRGVVAAANGRARFLPDWAV